MTWARDPLVGVAVPLAGGILMSLAVRRDPYPACWAMFFLAIGAAAAFGFRRMWPWMTADLAETVAASGAAGVFWLMSELAEGTATMSTTAGTGTGRNTRSQCPGYVRHWFVVRGAPGYRTPVCVRCGAPNPRLISDDDWAALLRYEEMMGREFGGHLGKALRDWSADLSCHHSDHSLKHHGQDEADEAYATAQAEGLAAADLQDED